MPTLMWATPQYGFGMKIEAERIAHPTGNTGESKANEWVHTSSPVFLSVSRSSFQQGELHAHAVVSGLP
jgi:hypothetical protein